MDWKTMEADLRRLGALIDGWSQTDQIPALERDLALEKLRNLYEAIRFAGTPSEPADGAESESENGSGSVGNESLPESIDLGEVLSLGAFPDLEESAEPIFAEPAAPFGAEAAMPTDGAEASEAPEVAQISDRAAQEPQESQEPEESEERQGQDPSRCGSEPIAPAEPAAAPEPFEPNELTGISGPVVISEPTLLVEPEPESDPAAAPASAPDTTPEPVATQDPQPESEPDPAVAKPQHAAHVASPTLFGMEEDEQTLRHRHKQRVIMSLYGPSPEAERTPAPLHPAAAELGSDGARPAQSASAHNPGEVHSDKAASVPTEPVASVASEAPTGQVASAESEKPVEPIESAAPVASAAPADRPTPPVVEAAIPTAGTVLGEVINHDVQTLADTIAPPRDIASELRRSEPVTDLRQAIGLNDKFLLIRDLFAGDGEAFERTVETLNGFDNLDDCMIFIAEHYAWNPNSDGAKLLMELLERKFA